LTDHEDGGTLLQRAEHALSSLITDEMREQKVAGRSLFDEKIDEKTVADVVRDGVLEGITGGVFDGYGPATSDRVVHERDDLVFQPAEPPTMPDAWPPSADTSDPSYWAAWAEWTVPFACENGYTARSSLERWGHPGEGWFDTVRKALIDKRDSSDDCPGLRAISEEEWQRFVRDR
jgi:hypothetical protein